MTLHTSSTEVEDALKTETTAGYEKNMPYEYDVNIMFKNIKNIGK